MRQSKFMAAFLAVAIVAPLPMSLARADVPAAVGLAKEDGTVTVTVVDEQGAAVADAKVALILPHKRDKSDNSATTKGSRPKPNIIARGETDADGTFTFKDIPDGTYIAIAGLKGKGIGHERVTVKTAGNEITITIKPHEKKK